MLVERAGCGHWPVLRWKGNNTKWLEVDLLNNESRALPETEANGVGLEETRKSQDLCYSIHVRGATGGY